MEKVSNIPNEYPDEVQEIIGRPPVATVLYGNIILFSIIILLILLASLIKLPNSKTIAVTIIGSPSECKIMAPSSGKIAEMFFKNRDKVRKGAILLVMDNPANTEDIIRLKSFVRKIDSSENCRFPKFNIEFPQQLKVGEIQQLYLKLGQVLRSIKFLGDSNSKRRIIESYRRDINQLVQKIENQILIWEEQFVVSTPVSGKLIFLQFWEPNQYLHKGDGIFVIVPNIKKLTVVAKVSVQSIYKVKKGARVIIRYLPPDSGYCVLSGSVEDLTDVPNGNYYCVKVRLDKPPDFKFGQKLVITGTADIVTDNKSILTRILEKIF